MNVFTETFITHVMTTLYAQHQTLGSALGLHAPAEPDMGAACPVRTQLELLVRVANGELLLNGPETRIEAVQQALHALLSVLTSNALALPAPYTDAFWQTDVGVLVSRVRWWLSADDIISISNAAALTFGTNSQVTRMRIVRAIENGLLEWIPDPSVANPQHSRRVFRSQVELLRDQLQQPVV